MKITSEMIQKLEDMIRRENEGTKNDKNETNYPALAGRLESMLLCIKHFDTLEDWFALVVK